MIHCEGLARATVCFKCVRICYKKKKEGKTKLKGQTVALYWLMLINGITNNSYE